MYLMFDRKLNISCRNAGHRCGVGNCECHCNECLDKAAAKQAAAAKAAAKRADAEKAAAKQAAAEKAAAEQAAAEKAAEEADAEAERAFAAYQKALARSQELKLPKAESNTTPAATAPQQTFVYLDYFIGIRGGEPVKVEILQSSRNECDLKVIWNDDRKTEERITFSELVERRNKNLLRPFHEDVANLELDSVMHRPTTNAEAEIDIDIKEELLEEPTTVQVEDSQCPKNSSCIDYFLLPMSAVQNEKKLSTSLAQLWKDRARESAVLSVGCKHITLCLLTTMMLRMKLPLMCTCEPSRVLLIWMMSCSLFFSDISNLVLVCMF